MTEVLVVGAGPVGLTMAAELARHGVRCRIIDRLSQPLPYCRAIGVTPRTLEVWDDMGIARAMIDGGLLAFRYVIGCDGAHSMVRRLLGIPFEGDAYPVTFMLGDVHLDINRPRSMALIVVRPVENGPPEIFVAIPLPERGRYRVSMRAPTELTPSGRNDHGVQTERPGPNLEQLQAVADKLLPEPARLSDLRWSSIFRISMRLAASYRKGPCFLAGDAAHIHPPTGGQGMNTGIQDAYNLAWKLALVVKGNATPALLDSYDAERRPVGAEVVARTTAASESIVRGSTPQKPDRLADTQIRISAVTPPLEPARQGYRPRGPVCRRVGRGRARG